MRDESTNYDDFTAEITLVGLNIRRYYPQIFKGNVDFSLSSDSFEGELRADVYGVEFHG